MIDSHTHLEHADEPDAWIDAARQVGVHGMISIGCGADSIRRTLEIARRHPGCVRVGAGVHPMSAAAFDMSTFDEIAQLARDPFVVAIGETGFDQHHDCGTIAEQMPAFVAQCQLARALGLPLIIHSRAAGDDTITALREHAADLDVVLHCFALTDEAHLSAVLAQERWFCSFAGNLTYPRSEPLRNAVAQIPLDRLMVETDAPYLAPVPHRGRRNQPAYVQHTLQQLADVRGITFDEARAATSGVAARVFGWSPAVTVEA